MGRENEATGFKSACAEFAEKSLSLDEKYLANTTATFIIEAVGFSRELDIKPKDRLIIDRSLPPQNGRLVLMVMNNQFTVIKFHQALVGGKDPETEDFVWGVVTAQIREFI